MHALFERCKILKHKMKSTTEMSERCTIKYTVTDKILCLPKIFRSKKIKKTFALEEAPWVFLHIVVVRFSFLV